MLNHNLDKYEYITTKGVKYILLKLLKKKKGYVFKLRDKKLLDSAIHATKNSYYRSIEDLAASYLNSFVHNHPFFDGNKRFAWVICLHFLKLNGYSLKNMDSSFWAEKVELFAAHKLESKDMAILLKENFIVKSNPSSSS